jgi:hypothetical protein
MRAVDYAHLNLLRLFLLWSNYLLSNLRFFCLQDFYALRSRYKLRLETLSLGLKNFERNCGLMLKQAVLWLLRDRLISAYFFEKRWFFYDPPLKSMLFQSGTFMWSCWFPARRIVTPLYSFLFCAPKLSNLTSSGGPESFKWCFICAFVG